MDINHEGFSASVSGQEAVKALSEIMLTRIRERERTKRLLIVVTFVLLAIAAFVPLFTPEGKEINELRNRELPNFWSNSLNLTIPP